MSPQGRGWRETGLCDRSAYRAPSPIRSTKRWRRQRTRQRARLHSRVRMRARVGRGNSRIPPTLAGVAAEYAVAAELSRRSYIASLTLKNTRGVDLLASNADASRSVGIQVKRGVRGGDERGCWIRRQRRIKPGGCFMYS